MSFTNLKIENFGLIKEFESDFDNLGLVLVQGSNPTSQVADSNDAGKTTLFEALLWGVWGKTLKSGDYKGKKVINWGSDQATVAIGFHGTDGQEYLISRTEHRKDKSKNALTLSKGDLDLTQISKVETQALIDQLLGIDFLTFTNTVIFGQHQVTKFAGLTDASVKDIFSKILDFESYDLALAETKRRITSVASESEEVSNNIMSLEMQIARGKEFLEEAQQKKIDFDDEKKARLGVLEKRKKAQEKELAKISKGLVSEEELLAQKQKYEDTYEEATKKINSIRDEANKIRDSIDKASSELSGLKVLADGLDKRGQEYEQEISCIDDMDICPECETEIDEAKKEKLSAKYKEKLKKVAQGIESAKNDMKIVAGNQERLNLSFADLQSKDATALAHMEEQRSKVSVIESQLNEWRLEVKKVDMAKNTLEGLEDEITRVKAETFTLGDMMVKETEKIKQAEKGLETNKKSLSKLEKKLKRLEFWREGFGNAGIKSLLIERVIPRLNSVAEQYSQVLTGGEIRITFTAQTQLKTGEFRERFNVHVESVSGGKDSCYDGSGGGFRRRTDLVIAFALRDLIMSQSKYSPNVVIYDECFGALDETGCETLLPFLEEQADEIGTVFVITHNNKFADQFQNVWQVRRDGSESTVEVL